jgi:hypothetical protein
MNPSYTMFLLFAKVLGSQDKGELNFTFLIFYRSI